MADLNELRARIEAAIPCEEYAQQHDESFDGDAYENAANHAAKVLLRAAARDPQAFKSALDAFRLEPYGRDIDACLTPEERTLLMEGEYGLSGFQWGWAVNAAAHLLEQPAVPNPGIVTIRSVAPSPTADQEAT